jgi:aerotaxis receptor
MIFDASSEEAQFGIHELFVSRTDKKGILVAGNEVFRRVSGYTSEQLIGSPHNIIRHPDMPRSVFRLFWQTLGEGRDMVAYVKNRDALGRHYWVLATAFPTRDGYVSVRLKPTSPLLRTVEELYKEVLALERSAGVEAGLTRLQERIRELGFRDYRTFMRVALQTEFQARDSALEESPQGWQGHSAAASRTEASELSVFLSGLASEIRTLSRKTSSLDQVESLILEKTSGIAGSVEHISALSINMSIAAHKMAKEGAALAVVANSVQDLAREVLGSNERFRSATQEALELFEQTLFGNLRIRVTVEMLAFHLAEVLGILRASSRSQAAESRAFAELSTLAVIADELCSQNVGSLESFFEKVTKVRREADQLHGQILRLALIRTGGKLEGSRTPKAAETFGPFISQLGGNLETLETPLSDLSLILKNALVEVSELLSRSKLTQHALAEAKLRLNFLAKSDDASSLSATGT